MATPSILVGRDDLLALAKRRLDETRSGHGEFLLLAGEAGIGKTRLLASITSHAARAGFAVVRASAFRGDAEISGSLLLDLASDLRRGESENSRHVRDAISHRIREPGAEADPRHSRRMLVRDLVDAFSELDRDCHRLVVLEDLHWADDLSLEVFEHIAHRLANRATLVVAAYRSDEIYPHTAIREWRQRLVSQRLAEEVRLHRLSRDETATLASTMLGGAAPAQLVTALYDRSDGIPLHIEELLGAASTIALDVLQVPETLSDAVLARAAALGAATRDIAATAAVIGRRFDFDLLVAIADRDENDVARCLRELQSAYLVVERPDAGAFDFRHALIRDALYADVALPRRRELHDRVATVAGRQGYGDAFVSLHFDQAGRKPDAYRHARQAADEATSVSAHREALELYRRAHRNLAADVGADERARLLEALGHEAAAVDDNEAAAQAYSDAQALWADFGDLRASAAIVPSLVAVRHLLGDDLRSRTQRIEDALATLADQPTCGEEARLLAALAAAYMLSRRLDEAIEVGERSCACCDVVGDVSTRVNTEATLGAVFVFAGRMDEGWRRLDDAIGHALAIRNEAEAARSYRVASTSASALVEYDRAKKWLDDGIPFAEKAELWNHHSYMRAHLAHVQWATGKWAPATDTAEHALADGRGGITTRITAQYVLGYLAMGRADWGHAVDLLTTSLAEAESMTELQRVLPPLWGLAETAVLREEHESAVSLCERAFAESEIVDDAAYLFPFLLTGTRARLAAGDYESASQWVKRVADALVRRGIPGTLPAVTHAGALLYFYSGDVVRAQEGFATAVLEWRARSRYWEGSWAELDEARCLVALSQLSDARAIVERVRLRAREVGASRLVMAAEDLLPEAGAPVEAWHPLTTREFHVATLVASGLTNREMADKLVLSPKTVSAHVEHILAKLGASRRAEIAAWATRVEAGRDVAT
jgi:DNA-binding CsgD family transcriptional regulator/tetratricopeptide (TPR) repeat protein